MKTLNTKNLLSILAALGIVAATISSAHALVRRGQLTYKLTESVSVTCAVRSQTVGAPTDSDGDGIFDYGDCVFPATLQCDTGDLLIFSSATAEEFESVSETDTARLESLLQTSPANAPAGAPLYTEMQVDLNLTSVCIKDAPPIRSR